MQLLTRDQASDFLECATIDQRIDTGRTLTTHGDTGTPDSPCKFVMVDDAFADHIVLFN